MLDHRKLLGPNICRFKEILENNPKFKVDVLSILNHNVSILNQNVCNMPQKGGRVSNNLELKIKKKSIFSKF